MRVWMRRRSSSIFVSPGPRLPMPLPAPTWPPACRDIDSPQPRRRGSRYSSCASSTCALPSRLLACWLKMSRITAVRSMTLTFTMSSSARRWLGASSVSATTVSAPSACDDPAKLIGLALAEVGAGIRMRALLQQAVEHPGAGRLGERRQLAQRVVGIGEVAARVDADQHDVLESQLPVLDLGDILELGAEPLDAAQRGPVLTVELVAVAVVVVLRSRSAGHRRGRRQMSRNLRRARHRAPARG